jgi:alpha-L-glutamate ligase-like protein
MGILGINKRNADYLLPVNQRRLYPLVDDKLLTKQLAIQNGLQVPRLYGVIRYHHQIPAISEIASRHPRFVVKPSMGSGGEGILALTRRNDGDLVRASGEVLSADELMYYISGILAGLYSLGGQDDKALVEYRVEPSPVFDMVAYQGAPDVRLIVYKGVPVLSMVRLPTSESKGKANLHHGAIGVGVDMQMGITLAGVHHDRVITTHPDTGEAMRGIQIPYWEDILRIGARSYDMTGLGYLGVDVVIDRTKGPMILEFNARPGLSIQIANHSGLVPRLEAVDEIDIRALSSEERIAFGQSTAQKFASYTPP